MLFLPFLFKGTKKEETTYNFNFVYTFSVTKLLLPSSHMGTYSLAGCLFPIFLLEPLLGGGRGTSTTLGEGEAPPPPQGTNAQWSSLPHCKSNRPLVNTRLTLQFISKIQNVTRLPYFLATNLLTTISFPALQQKEQKIHKYPTYYIRNNQIQAIIDRLTTYMPSTGETGSATTTKYINISVSKKKKFFLTAHGFQFTRIQNHKTKSQH